jgi:hypothetical protein
MFAFQENILYMILLTECVKCTSALNAEQFLDQRHSCEMYDSHNSDYKEVSILQGCNYFFQTYNNFFVCLLYLQYCKFIDL